MNKPVLLTGFRPTGDLHLGHYFSLIDPIIRMQNNYKIYVLVADLHALTEFRKYPTIDYQMFKNDIHKYTVNALTILSHFVDINKLVIFKQSDLMRYHYDLFYKLLMLSKHNLTFGNPVFIDAMQGEYYKSIDALNLNPQVKKVLKKFIEYAPELLWGNISNHLAHDLANYLTANDVQLSNQVIDRIVKILNTRSGVTGFATYPILMAADIILYSPKYVLVGNDQAPHLYITNELIKIVNNTFGLELDKVSPMIDHAQTLKGNDGRKMSKTFDNHLPLEYLLMDEQAGMSWCMKLKTFSKLKGEPGKVDECLAGEYSKLFDINHSYTERCIDGSVGCVECKQNLFIEIRNHFMNNKSVASYKSMTDIFDLGKIHAENRIVQNTELLKILV